MQSDISSCWPISGRYQMSRLHWDSPICCLLTKIKRHFTANDHPNVWKEKTQILGEWHHKGLIFRTTSLKSGRAELTCLTHLVTNKVKKYSQCCRWIPGNLAKHTFTGTSSPFQTANILLTRPALDAGKEMNEFMRRCTLISLCCLFLSDGGSTCFKHI